jgi:hypothetical protein
MAEFLIKRTIFLTPKGKVEGNKSLTPIPNRVTLKKGDKFEGTILRSNDPNVESILSFSYSGYTFEKPYGGTDAYAQMNKRDLPMVGTPEAQLIIYTPRTSNTMVQDGSGLPNRGFPQNNGGNSIAVGESNPNAQTTKSTNGVGILQFKDKLHAGITLVGVAFGVYYAYKTKASVAKYIGYALGAGAVGFIVGSVTSSYIMQTPIREKKTDNQIPDLAKPAFTGTISPNIGQKGGKLDTSVEGGTMESQMNSIL